MKMLSYEKDIFFVQAKMRSEVFCWKVARRRGRWTPPQPTTVTMWPESMRNSSKVLCITTTAILLRYAFCIFACITSPHPSHCLLVLPRQSINHKPPIHHRIFFCLLSIVWKSPFYQTQRPYRWINYVHTNSLHNRLVPSKSWRFTFKLIVKIIYLLSSLK